MSFQSPRLACFITTNSQRAEKKLPKFAQDVRESDMGRYNWILGYSVPIIKIFITSSYKWDWETDLIWSDKWVLEYNVQHGDYIILYCISESC